MATAGAAAVEAAMAVSRSVRGESVAYTRGGTTIAVDRAVRGTTDWDRTAPFSGVRLGDRSTDWLILASSLVSGGTQFEPTRGDEIVANGVTFRVMPFGPEKQLWSWHDRGRTTYRIHTKERD